MHIGGKWNNKVHMSPGIKSHFLFQMGGDFIIKICKQMIRIQIH